MLHEANRIILAQMAMFRKSGLLDALDLFVVGCNGGNESLANVKLCFPAKAKVIMHGLDSRGENLTFIEREKFVAALPEGEEWLILAGHSKGVTHEPGGVFFRSAGQIRDCMMEHCVNNWLQCVMDLMAGKEAVGCHWLTNMGEDHSQSLFCGNFYWAKSSFLRTIPSMITRDRIKRSGIKALESRYESEVWIGIGPRLPIIKDYCPRGYLLCSTIT